MVVPKASPSELLAAKLLESLNSEGTAHVVTDTVMRTWSSIETPNDIKECKEAQLIKYEDGSYHISIGYTTESGRYIDCWGLLGASESCISKFLQPNIK